MSCRFSAKEGTQTDDKVGKRPVERWIEKKLERTAMGGSAERNPAQTAEDHPGGESMKGPDRITKGGQLGRDALLPKRAKCPTALIVGTRKRGNERPPKARQEETQRGLKKVWAGPEKGSRRSLQTQRLTEGGAKKDLKANPF